MTKNKELYEKIISSGLKGDIDTVLENYHDDAELSSFEFVLKGKEAIKKYMTEGERAQAGEIYSFDTVYFAESDDVVIYTGVVKTEKIKEFIDRNAWYLRDGKIARHISLTLPPQKDLYASAE